MFLCFPSFIDSGIAIRKPRANIIPYHLMFIIPKVNAIELIIYFVSYLVFLKLYKCFYIELIFSSDYDMYNCHDCFWCNGYIFCQL